MNGEVTAGTTPREVERCFHVESHKKFRIKNDIIPEYLLASLTTSMSGSSLSQNTKALTWFRNINIL